MGNETTEGQLSPQERGAQWSPLTTAEEVVAAHDSGLRVWNRPRKRCRWAVVENRGVENIRSFLAMGWEYRAKATGTQP